MATPRRISDIKPLLTNLAQTSHYQVIFGGLSSQLTSYIAKRGVTSLFYTESAGLLCYNASLPTTNFTPKTVDGNFTGIMEKFALSRMYNEISLDFYVDSDYLIIKFLESWMEFIASGSHNPIGANAGPVSQGYRNYFVRMQYPEYYKCNNTKIIKFDRNYQTEIEYTFVGLWPIAMSSPTISYIQSDALKVSVSFQYDRYIAGRALSINYYNGDSNNLTPSSSASTPTSNAPIYYQSAGAGVDQGVTQRPAVPVYPTTF